MSCDKRCDFSSIIFLQNEEKKFFKRKDLLQVEEPPVVQTKKPKLSDSPPASEPVKNNVDLIEERLASKERLLPREEVCVAINCTLCSVFNFCFVKFKMYNLFYFVELRCKRFIRYIDTYW